MQNAIEKPFYDVSAADMTAGNFPAFKHAWFCDDTDYKFRDRFGGLVLRPGSSTTPYTHNADGTSLFAAAMNTIDSGAWVAPGTKNVLAMVFGASTAVTTSYLDFGSVATAANNGFRIGANHLISNPPAIAANVASVASGNGFGTAITNTSLIYCRALAIKWNNVSGLTPYRFDGTTFSALPPSDLSATGVQITALATMDASVLFNLQNFLSLILIGHFTILPTPAEIEAAIRWTLARLVEATPRKLIWPGFMGRT